MSLPSLASVATTRTPHGVDSTYPWPRRKCTYAVDHVSRLWCVSTWSGSGVLLPAVSMPSTCHTPGLCILTQRQMFKASGFTF